MTVIGNSQETPGLLDPAGDNHKRQIINKSSSTTIVLGAVVRLQPAKRLDLLLHAAHTLSSRGHAVEVLLVGDGPESERLRALAAELGVEARFPGAIYELDELHRVYSEIDITVLPEFAGLTVISSLARGVPVITVDDPYRQVPEFRAVVDGVTGGLYAADNLQSLVDTLAFWIARVRTEPELVFDACQAEIKARWTPEANANRILEAIQRGSSQLRV